MGPVVALDPDPCIAIEAALDRDAAQACLTVPLGAAREAAARSGQEACLDAALVARGWVPAAKPANPDTPGTRSAKLDTDAPGSWPGTLTGDNFVVKWGTSGGVSDAEAEELLAYMEYAWAFQIDDMDYPSPPGTDTYLLNVYIGGTGSGTPTTDAAGYHTTDSHGRSYLVINKDILDKGDYLGSTSAHEFFHGVQQGCDTAYTYSSDSPGAWYWEATAMWMEGEAYPADPYYYDFLWSYGLFPHLPINFFEYWTSSSGLESYRQYGAGIFPRYLTEHAADVDLIQLSWVDTNLTEDDPLEVIDEHLRDLYGTDLVTVFSDFTAHTAVWDYADGEDMEDLVEDYGSWYHLEMFVAEHDAPVPDWEDVSGDVAPQRFGTNYVSVEPAGEYADILVEFEGDASGNEGSPATWEVRVVLDDDGSYSYVETEMTGPTLTARVEGGSSADRVVLAISVVDGLDEDEESAGYRYRVTEIEPVEPPDTDPPGDTGQPTEDDTGDPVQDTSSDDPDPEDPEPAGCGCASSPRPVFTALPALALLAGWRRRRTAR
jgi:MYXO-CTERM domain-containing protein